jgi:hypothetical protein
MATKAEIASAEERLAEHFIDREGVDKRKAFASDALMINGKMFVIFRKGSIVVKLPPEKGPKLVRAKEAKPFEPSPGRVMKRWFVFPPKVTDERRIEVAEMSFDYVVSEQERSD